MLAKSLEVGIQLWAKHCGHVKDHQRSRLTQDPFNLVYGHEEMLPLEIHL